MRRFVILVLVLLVGLPGALRAAPVHAHQPYCEEEDLGPAAPFHVEDPSVSVAFYGTLFPQTDVDYFTFEGRAGDRVLLSLVIPRIEGQERFTPVLALFGDELPPSDVPAAVVRPESAGVLIMPALAGEPATFVEPFSRTSYWERQEIRVPLPADGTYTAAVWHLGGQVGRYVFVIGEKEVMGGDLGCLAHLSDYWTPVDPVAGPPEHHD